MASKEIDIDEAWNSVKNELIRSIGGCIVLLVCSKLFDEQYNIGFHETEVTPVPSLSEANEYRILNVFKLRDRTLKQRILGHQPEIIHKGQVEDIIGDDLDVDVKHRCICVDKDVRVTVNKEIIR
jgi:hypothetical protein